MILLELSNHVHHITHPYLCVTPGGDYGDDDDDDDDDDDEDEDGDDDDDDDDYDDDDDDDTLASYSSIKIILFSLTKSL